MVDIFHALGVDAVVLGNHEFDLGEQVLRDRISESRFPWLGTNVQRDGQPFPGVLPHMVVERDGIRIGLFGVCTAATRHLSWPEEDTAFEDVEEISRQCVKVLREEEKVDLVVALTHISIAEDKQLAQNVDGIDIILGGHDHHPYMEQIRSTWIMKAGHDAQFLGRADVLIRTTTTTTSGVPKPSVVTDIICSGGVESNMGYAPDPDVMEVVEKYKVSSGDPKETFAVTKVPLVSTTNIVRMSEGSMPNLVADAMRHSLHADIGTINGGFVRGDAVYPAGHRIRRLDLERELPFPCPTTKIAIKGIHIWKGLDEVLSHTPNLSGAFPHVSGIQVRFDPSAEPGARVRSIEFDDPSRTFDTEETYTMALTTFQAEGGDGLTEWPKGKLVPHPNTGRKVFDVVVQYLKTMQLVGEIKNNGKRMQPIEK